MTPACDVAKHLIRLAAIDPEGEPMTAMRLHKLLYYCQGWYLAWYGRPLFPERLEAWKNGPVVPSLRELPWIQDGSLFTHPGELIELPGEVKAAVEQVWSHYRAFSACGLRDKTHEEPPWKNHYKPDGELACSAEIPPVEMAAFFGAEYRRLTGDEPGAAAEFEANVSAGHVVTLEELQKELDC